MIKKAIDHLSSIIHSTDINRCSALGTQQGAEKTPPDPHSEEPSFRQNKTIINNGQIHNLMSGGDSPTGRNKAGPLVTFILHPGVCLASSWQLRAGGTPDAHSLPREDGKEAQVLWS